MAQSLFATNNQETQPLSQYSQSFNYPPTDDPQLSDKSGTPNDKTDVGDIRLFDRSRGPYTTTADNRRVSNVKECPNFRYAMHERGNIIPTERPPNGYCQYGSMTNRQWDRDAIKVSSISFSDRDDKSFLYHQSEENIVVKSGLYFSINYHFISNTFSQ